MTSNDFIPVRFRKSQLLNLFMQEVYEYNISDTKLHLLERMYESQIDEGKFNNACVDIEQIVRDDMKRTFIVTMDAVNYQKIRNAYNLGERETKNLLILSHYFGDYLVKNKT